MSQSAVKNVPAKTPEKASPKRRRVITPLGVVLLCVLFLLLAAGVTASAYALSYDRIYPGLSAYGIDFGGMTREEAGRALARQTGDLYAGTSVTLSLDGHSVTVTAEDARVSLSADEAAEAVYRAGRSGGVFSRLSYAFSSLYFGRSAQLPEDEFLFYIDREAVSGAVSSLCDEHLLAPVEYTWEIGTNAIEVSGGTDGLSSDPEAMTGAVIQSFTGRDFTPLFYQSEPVPPAPLPLRELHDRIKVAPEDAYVVLDGDRQASIVPHVVGVSFDLQKAEETLAKRPDRFSIPLLYHTPEITAASLEENLFRDLLGEYGTSTVGSSQNRVTNIRLTAEYMTGATVLPGENFSFNEVVGERTEERGFKMAGSYLNGKIVDAIGGGVCQSSTTLYNAALLSNLHIVERQAHSMTVGYVPLGRDAAVDWGRIEFVFSNDTAYPIRVTAWHEKSRLTVQIWGTKTDDLTVSVENEIIAHRPAETVTEYNPALAPGAKSTKIPGSDGYTVQTYRVLKGPDGKTVYRNPEARSGYMRVNTVIEVGPSTGGDIPGGGDADGPPPAPDPEPLPNPEPEPPPGPDPPEEPEEPVTPPEPETEQEDIHDL